MNGKIEYGFGKEYLSNWTLKEALREVLQNYIDYGEYNISTKEIVDNPDIIKVRISNNYIPEKLEFLRIGNTDKGGNSNAIGHHGEGLKVAFLIFLREGLLFKILTNDLMITPTWSMDELVGETLRIQYTDTNIPNDKFITILECPRDVYEEFISDIITEFDIIHNHSYGDVVDKPKGNIYSGNLFVCNIAKLSNAYNIKPCNLPLDRDRSVPSDWDIQYYTSKILQSYNQAKEVSVTTKELEGKDYAYTDELPDNIVNQFNRRRIGNKNVYINKVDNEHIQNRRITEILDKHPKFAKYKKVSARQQFKYKLEKTKRKSLKTLVKDFKSNYCKSTDMLDDINIIIKRL